MHNGWLASIPDEIPPEALEEIEDPLQRLDFQQAHQKLKMLDEQNTRRQRELLEKHGLVRETRGDLNSRMRLLIDMFIGVNTLERMQYEIKWQEQLAVAIENGYAEALDAIRARKEAKTLHLPGGGQHVVKKEGTDADPG